MFRWIVVGFLIATGIGILIYLCHIVSELVNLNRRDLSKYNTEVKRWKKID